MSKYVEQNLMPEEKILYAAKIHWGVYFIGSNMMIFGLLLLSLKIAFLGMLLLLGGIVVNFAAWIYTISTELVITNKRVFSKTGLISRHTIELLHSKVESFYVEQGIFARIFNYGSVGIHGTGGAQLSTNGNGSARTPIRYIADPLSFRREALTAIEDSENKKESSK